MCSQAVVNHSFHAIFASEDLRDIIFYHKTQMLKTKDYIRVDDYPTVLKGYTHNDRTRHDLLLQGALFIHRRKTKNPKTRVLEYLRRDDDGTLREGRTTLKVKTEPDHNVDRGNWTDAECFAYAEASLDNPPSVWKDWQDRWKWDEPESILQNIARLRFGTAWGRIALKVSGQRGGESLTALARLSKIVDLGEWCRRMLQTMLSDIGFELFW